MIREGDSVAAQESLPCDVCIVGGGPAGLTLAAELLGSGLRVLVVESGAGQPPEGGERYERSDNVGLPYKMELSRVRGLGGSALHWDVDTPAGGPRVRLRELDALDFETHGGMSAWPFLRATLDPHYARARALMHLEPAAADNVTEDGALSERVFSFAPASIFTATLPGRLAADRDTVVLVDTTVTAVAAPGPGRPVTAVELKGPSGQSATVRAKVYVLAAGGIENARLLLASRSSTPRGVGNEHGHVGRHFMEHPHLTSAALVPTDRGLQERSELWDVHLRAGHPVQRKYGLSQALRRREGLQDVAYYLTPRPVTWPLPLTASGASDARGMAAIRHVRRSVMTGRPTPGLGRDLTVMTWAAPLLGVYVARQTLALRAVRRGRRPAIPVVFTVGAMAEQESSTRSSVSLGDRRDRFGVPVARLDWQLSEADRHSLTRSQQLIAPLLGAAVGGRVVPLLPDDELPGLGWGCHHMGTTRMAVRPEDGVVDADSRVHGVDNLFVAGSSVFPSGGSANPTLTLLALTMRLADHLRRELRVPTLTRS